MMDSWTKKSSVMYGSLVLLFLLFATSEATCDPNDKQVLLKIKDHFQNIAPFSNWDPKTDCCGWGNTQCSPSGRVTGLFVSDTVNTTFEFPSIIGDLPMLELLMLDQIPGLMGSIPESITNLTNLHQLVISYTNVSGPIPDFSRLKNLYKLDLPNNRLTGTIPSYLHLLPNLFEIDLEFNMLSGSIPESFGLFKNEMSLWLGANGELSGQIPKSLGNVNFSVIYLSYNKFQGDASFLLGKDKPILEITLDYNQLEFDFSDVQLPLGIRVFDISHNKVYGSLNKQLGLLGNLDRFSVSYNQLCGKIPKGRRFKQVSPAAFDHNKCLCDAPGLPPCSPP